MLQRFLILGLLAVLATACREKHEPRARLDIPLNQKIDALLKEAQAATDDNRKAALFGEASELLIEKGDLRQAMVAARQGERANPTQRQCLTSIAEIQLSEGKIAEAATTLADTLQRHPKYGRAHYVHGNLLASKTDYKAALQSYAKAEQNGFAEQRLYLNSAGVALRGKKAAEALATYERALKKFPNLAEASLGAGIAAGQLNKKKEARKYFETYLTLAPNSSEAGRVRSWLKKL
ncbi:MAG TPA: tetratricopeptide repeat protein [Turneriella sp.]|nr:tetratricopeptide repeat protein [Turneriella sp.]HNJ66576.1 tetratricopeptide repeat protein [Turneriella sp.]HNL10187.1 tetratricopeptide repeat protein [Turneriella sp.]HNM99044.1 tetratricopeptide repeat protein [Turneriella sp.]